ncbi:MAG: hypothetical protein KatS3mg005_1789 [Bryobacteraceae bacterium]|nr:MAG: hypothetical protein KatS3mg005_1789 [Bryobacteraceae bacterium]
MKRLFSCLTFFLAVIAASGQIVVFVSPDGDDSHPGTFQAPFATLERARAAVRGGGVVWLRGGVYHRTSTLELGPEDSNVVWYGLPGEPVRIAGGRRIRNFAPSPNRPNVWQTDLKAQGIEDFGALRSRGVGRSQTTPAALELFFNGKPMPLARWPNRGWAYIASVPGGSSGGRFTVASDRVSLWANAADVWVHGFWTYDWADSYERVESIDVHAREIRTAPPHGIYGYSAGKRFEVLNVLDELDEPGEWYLDRNSGILYFWPPAPLEGADVWVSLLEAPLVTMRDTENVRFENIVFEYARGYGVHMTGGARNTIARCTFRNLGLRAVYIDQGFENGVEDSVIEQTGEGGIYLRGGDRITLTPSRHFAVGNRISNYSRVARAYRPAISLNGAGVLAYRNLIFSAPHQAISLSGNDHLIQGNEIHTVAWETQDVGALYFGRDWTMRGNIIRGNYFHNLGNGDVSGVYLDDCASGTLVENNVFHRARRSVFIGGGRDNIVRGNLFCDSDPAVQVDARGLTTKKAWFDGTDPILFNRLKAMPYQQPPWSDRYPELVNILNDEPAIPKGNVIEGNASFGGRWLDLRDNTAQWVRVENNLVEPLSIGIPSIPPLGDPVPVINYRVQKLSETNPLHFRLTIENLGVIAAEGEVLLWAWPDAGVRFLSPTEVPFRLTPGAFAIHEFKVDAGDGVNEVRVGAQLRGSDLRPTAVRAVVKR